MSKPKKLSAGSALATGLLAGMPVQAATDLDPAADMILEVYADPGDADAHLLRVDEFHLDAPEDLEIDLAQTYWGGSPDDVVSTPGTSGSSDKDKKTGTLNDTRRPTGGEKLEPATGDKDKKTQ